MTGEEGTTLTRFWSRYWPWIVVSVAGSSAALWSLLRRRSSKRVARQWIDVPRDVLANNKSDAVLVLRLGAFANAVQGCVSRLAEALQEPDTAATERDRFVLFLAAAGYIKEAVDHIQHHQARLRQLLNVARRSGYPLQAKWTELEGLLTTAAGSVYDRVLKRVRHDLAFHFREEVFSTWIDRGAEATVRMWYVAGTKNAGRLYRASSDALAFELAEGKEATDPSVRDAFGAVRDAQLMLLPVTEAALIGFLVAAGVDPKDYYQVEYEN